jgi:hypothetical protein
VNRPAGGRSRALIKPDEAQSGPCIFESMDLKKRSSSVVPLERHGHLITPGSAEGERDVVEAALQNQERKQSMVNRQRRGREMRVFPRQAGNRKAV